MSDYRRFTVRYLSLLSTTTMTSRRRKREAAAADDLNCTCSRFEASERHADDDRGAEYSGT